MVYIIDLIKIVLLKSPCKVWIRSECNSVLFFFFSSRRRHTRLQGDWSSDVCSSDLHGTLNAMFLPAVVRFNAEAESVRAEQRLQRMAHAMGLDSGSDIPEAIRDMNARLGLPTGLAAMGVERAQFAAVIGGALKDHCHGTNPRLASADDYEQMLATSL